MFTAINHIAPPRYITLKNNPTKDKTDFNKFLKTIRTSLFASRLQRNISFEIAASELQIFSNAFERFYNVNLRTDEVKQGKDVYTGACIPGSMDNGRGFEVIAQQEVAVNSPNPKYDAFTQTLIDINKWNPLAQLMDAVSGYIYGTDRLGNPISNTNAP